MPKKKVLVLGATGMLGHKLCQELRRAGHHVVPCVRGDRVALRAAAEVLGELDLHFRIDALDGNRLEAEIERQRPDFVVNAVGVVKQLEEASDPCLTIAINSLLPHRLARTCGELGVRLIHVSSDCVFDGSRGGYCERDTPDATDLYGRTKALGETTDDETAALTLRTSFIGRELTQPTHGLVEWLLSNNHGTVRGFKNVIYTGLTSLELARVVSQLVTEDGRLTGVYQVAGPLTTKCELLQLIGKVYGLDVTITPVEEPRCDRSLVMDRFNTATGYVPPDWHRMILEMRADPTPYERLGRERLATEPAAEE